jgi:hypothetical protein
VLVNYFARELQEKWRYDEFESGTMRKFFAGVRPPQGGEKTSSLKT